MELERKYSMIALGKQLAQSSYLAFSAAVRAATSKPLQIANAAGKCVISGDLIADEVATVQALYAQFSAAPTGFDMLAHQSMERRRSQTHNARMKRQAQSNRLHRG
jgi:hypothetical protein